MKPSTLFLLLVFIVTIGLSACVDTQPTSVILDPADTIPVQQLDTSVIIPLKAGNRWKHRMYEMDSAGTILKTVYDSLILDTMKLINGRWWYQVGPDSYFINLDDGFWSLNNYSDSAKYHSYGYLKYPVEVGDSFITDTLGPVGKAIRPVIEIVTVVATGVEITVPAGTFRCICYRYDTRYFDGSTYEDEAFFAYCAPGVGVIQTLFTGYRQDGKRFLWAKRELVEIDLK